MCQALLLDRIIVVPELIHSNNIASTIINQLRYDYDYLDPAEYRHFNLWFLSENTSTCSCFLSEYSLVPRRPDLFFSLACVEEIRTPGDKASYQNMCMRCFLCQNYYPGGIYFPRGDLWSP